MAERIRARSDLQPPWSDTFACPPGIPTGLDCPRPRSCCRRRVAAAGVAALFVPLPTAVDDHQTFNARELTRLGGGWLLPHKEFTPDYLKHILLDLLEHPKKLLVASQSLKVGYEKNAIKKLAKEVLFV